MISKQDIEFESDVQENVTIEDVREEYSDGVIIWLNGSGASPSGKPGAYRCVLDYMGHIKYMEKKLEGATANQAMIIGATDAIQCINKPVRLYLVCTTALGLARGFRGSGPNGSLVQKMYELIKKKECTLTEVQCINCGDVIKEFVYSCNPDESKHSDYEKSKADKRKYKQQYKDILYNECISQVVEVLRTNNVSSYIIDEVRKIKPE